MSKNAIPIEPYKLSKNDEFEKSTIKNFGDVIHLISPSSKHKHDLQAYNIKSAGLTRDLIRK